MDPGFVFVLLLLLLQNRRTGTIPAFALSLIEPSGMGRRWAHGGISNLDSMSAPQLAKIPLLPPKTRLHGEKLSHAVFCALFSLHNKRIQSLLVKRHTN
jgi:hypothetical protein